MDENLEFAIEDVRGATEENQALIKTAVIPDGLRKCMVEQGIENESLMLDMYNEARQSTKNKEDRLKTTIQLYYTRLDIEAELARNPASAKGEGEDVRITSVFLTYDTK